MEGEGVVGEIMKVLRVSGMMVDVSCRVER